MNVLRLSVTLTLLVSAAYANADKFSIHSRYDNYDLNVTPDGHGDVGGKPVDAKILKEVLPLFTSPASNDCPSSLKGQADATVKVGEKTRLVYLNAGQVKEGDQCLKVDGDGLQFFPVSREFLIGAESDSVPLKGDLTLKRGEQTLLRLKKEGEEWTSEDSTALLNWDFVERLENSLKSFRVRFRALPSITKGKPEVKITSGGQAYRFYKIDNQTWAVLKPGARWLEASDDWSFWYNLDDSVLIDRNAPAIRIVADRAGQSLPDRLAAIDKIGNTWSPNLRELYLKIVSDPQDVSELQAVAMKRLRSKPSEGTARGLGRVFAQIPDDNLKRSASQVLKMYYPKGPLYNPNGTPSQKQQVTDFWSNRWGKKSAP